MKLPELSHLQIFTLCMIDDHEGEVESIWLRDQMYKLELVNNHPAFYQLLKRMEETSLIRKVYKNTYGATQLRGRPSLGYAITKHGKRVKYDVLNFYQRLHSGMATLTR